MHKSIATIQPPEFLNLQPLDINPLISQCEVKVMYTGLNRNGSFISKETASKIAKTLRGSPIVGFFKKETGDFADHGKKIVIDDEGLREECQTVPYGFVPPDAKIWFQTFEDYDEFGNIEVREYLMTQAFLWTGQYEECQKVLDEGRPQSMEFDPEKNFEGTWAKNEKTGSEFFILNDAIFSKLCILGDKVEPCFEGSSVTEPEISKNFTISDNGNNINCTLNLDEDFQKTLFTMKQELQQIMFSLSQINTEGGEKMADEKDTQVIETSVETEFVDKKKEEPEEKKSANTDSDTADKDTKETETPDAEEDKKKDKTGHALNDKEKDKETDQDAEKKEDKENEEEKKKYSLLEEKYEALSREYSSLKEATKDYAELKEQNISLKAENEKLSQFKADIDNKEKDAMIDSFYMLSDEDKKDVIENKANYSLQQIEEKLSVICVRNKVSFSEEKEPTEEVMTYSLQEEVVPAYITALRNNKKNNQ